MYGVPGSGWGGTVEVKGLEEAKQAAERREREWRKSHDPKPKLMPVPPCVGGWCMDC